MSRGARLMRHLGQLAYLLLTLGVDAIRIDRFVGDGVGVQSVQIVSISWLLKINGL
jgi:hypothetical protein